MAMQTPFPIFSLPLEILFLIFECLPRRDLLCLNAVSKRFLRLIAPRIFSTISMEKTRDIHSLLLVLKSISTSSSNILAPAVKALCIHLAATPRTDQGKIDEAVILEHLVLCLTKLQNLETVSWTYFPSMYPPSYVVPIIRSLSSLPKLKNVTIFVVSTQETDQDQLPPLRCFRNLVSLSISYSLDLPRAYCDQEIVPAIAASPELTRFSLNNRCEFERGETRASLQSLLGKSRPGLMQLKLDRVSVPTAVFTQIISCKLQELSVTTPPGSRDLDFHWAKLWLMLKEVGVELSTLSVKGSEKAMDDMFDYLVSYTGLRKLKIRGIQMDRQDLEDSAGYMLWNQILPHHKDTLTELVIAPCYKGVWCYGPAATETILQCSSLRKLTLSVCSVDSSWAKAKLLRERKNNNVKFYNLCEPYGKEENCGALILCDLISPLEKLTLKLPNDATNREIDLDRGRCAERFSAGGFCRRGRIRRGIIDVLLTMRASAAASKNWPSIVHATLRRLLKDGSKKDTNRRRYRIGRWRCQSCEQSECESECESDDDEDERVNEGGDLKDDEAHEGDGEGDDLEDDNGDDEGDGDGDDVEDDNGGDEGDGERDDVEGDNGDDEGDE